VTVDYPVRAATDVYVVRETGEGDAVVGHDGLHRIPGTIAPPSVAAIPDVRDPGWA